MRLRGPVHRTADRVRWGAHLAASWWQPRVPLHESALDCVLLRSRGSVYCVPQASLHRPAAVALRRGRLYEPETRNLLETAGPGDVVHAGTFFGDFLPALSRSRRDGELVWAFEPNPASVRCARATVLLNGLGNVRLTAAALDSRPTGTALLATVGASGRSLGGGSRLVPGSAGPHGARYPGRVEEVALTTVDSTVPPDRHVAVLQLDVEGHEQAALTGALATIERCRPLLVLESLPDEQWQAEHLEPLGYRVAGRVDHNNVLRCRPGPAK